MQKCWRNTFFTLAMHADSGAHTCLESGHPALGSWPLTYPHCQIQHPPLDCLRAKHDHISTGSKSTTSKANDGLLLVKKMSSGRLLDKHKDRFVGDIGSGHPFLRARPGGGLECVLL